MGRSAGRDLPTTMVAIRSRSRVFGLCVLGTAIVLAAQLLSPAFIQQAPKGDGTNAAVASALGAAAALSSSLPVHAVAKYEGPLTGTSACTKPLIYFIYPLCDPISIISPLYMTPFLIIFFGTIIPIIQLLVPATQPDEDLRV